MLISRKRPFHSIRAIIFDMDGTLIDSFNIDHDFGGQGTGPELPEICADYDFDGDGLTDGTEYSMCTDPGGKYMFPSTISYVSLSANTFPFQIAFAMYVPSCHSQWCSYSMYSSIFLAIIFVYSTDAS